MPFSLCSISLSFLIVVSLANNLPGSTSENHLNTHISKNVDAYIQRSYTGQSIPYGKHTLLFSLGIGRDIALKKGKAGSNQASLTKFLFIIAMLLAGDIQSNPDRAPLKEVLGGQYNYREGGRQVLRQGA